MPYALPPSLTATVTGTSPSSAVALVNSPLTFPLVTITGRSLAVEQLALEILVTASGANPGTISTLNIDVATSNIAGATYAQLAGQFANQVLNVPTVIDAVGVTTKVKTFYTSGSLLYIFINAPALPSSCVLTVTVTAVAKL